MFKYRNSLIGRIVFILIFLGACTRPAPTVYVEGEIIPVDVSNIPEKDMAVDSVIAIYRTALEEEMNQVLAISAHTMERGSPEGLLNNFVADLIMETGERLYVPGDGQGIDFTLLNYGGLRTSIPAGEVTRARIFELMPFENEMVVLTLSPVRTEELFQYLAEARVGMPVSGIELLISNNHVEEVTIQGESFDPGRNYKVLTSDYLAGGGDNMVFFLEPMQTEYLNLRIRDAIIKFLVEQHERGLKIESELDGRIRRE
ncbi:MAG: UDP-sugar hydrolase [Bacteroidia bacterium]|nr:MAG: UDP-sugar hydrolase [Bacteroidia bacterium]